jgi:glycosyltransferase involved in cell wall biosynthesis
MKKLKILFVGGEDIHMRISLLSALRQRGFSVGAIGSEDGKAFEKVKIPYRSYSLHRWIGPFADIRTLRELVKIFKDMQPDIVHGFDTKPSIYVPIAGKIAGVSITTRTITGMGYVFSSDTLVTKILKPIYRLLHRIAARSTDITIFQNPDDQAYFEDNCMLGGSVNHLVRSSGIDIDEFLQKVRPENVEVLRRELGLDGKFVVTMVSRLVRDKGVVEFLKTAREVKRKNNNIVFLLVGPIVGEGKQAISFDDVKSFADCVTYLGARKDIPDILRISDLFVLPSYYREGVPRVLLEAGVIGLPLITTDMPGCKEVVRNNWNGWLVPARNEGKLIEAIESAINKSPEELKVMGHKSRAHVEEFFTLSSVVSSYEKIYQNALSKAK